MVVAHVVFELVASLELLLAHGAPEGGPGHAVQGGAELGAALSRVHHVLNLEEAGGHLDNSQAVSKKRERLFGGFCFLKNLQPIKSNGHINNEDKHQKKRNHSIEN